jgi:hypothetical protein
MEKISQCDQLGGMDIHWGFFSANKFMVIEMEGYIPFSFITVSFCSYL